MGRPKKDYETVNKDGIYRLTVRMNEKQYRLTKTLAKYLYHTGVIERESINATVNYAVLFLADVIAREAEKASISEAEEVCHQEEIGT